MTYGPRTTHPQLGSSENHSTASTTPFGRVSGMPSAFIDYPFVMLLTAVIVVSLRVIGALDEARSKLRSQPSVEAQGQRGFSRRSQDS